MSVVLSDAACALERLATERRSLSSSLLSMDAYDRWGYPEDREELYREQAKLSRRHEEVTKLLGALIARTRREDPSSVKAWAAAHVSLLEAYVAACVEKEAGGERSTERFVAEGEREAWLRLAAGDDAVVDENTFYVSIDAAAFEAFFGFSPR